MSSGEGVHAFLKFQYYSIIQMCVADRPVGQVDWIPDSDWSAGQRCSKRCGRPMREELTTQSRSVEHFCDVSIV